MKKLTEQEATKILEEDAVPSTSRIKGLPAFALYAEIDTTPQELRHVRQFFALELSLPAGLPTMAREVLIRLFRCFAKAKKVDEGLIGDLMFGFSQFTVEMKPLPPEATWAGLQQLKNLGYIAFQAKDGTFVDAESDKITSAWVRYQPKLLEIVYERGD